MAVVNKKQQEFGAQLNHMIDEYRDEGLSYSDIVGCLEMCKLQLVVEAQQWVEKREGDSEEDTDPEDKYSP